MDTVKISWSGGKDSTAATLLHLYRGDKCKVVCYVPLFDADTPLIRKQHYEHIMKTADLFRSRGAEVWVVHGQTYVDHFYRRSTRGKYKGRMFCWPCFIRGACGFKRDSKEKALNSINVGNYDYQDIGIAADEVDRHGQLNNEKRSILVEMGYTEKDAKILCKEKGCLSPIYETTGRDGCALCPHAKESERLQWMQEYPQVGPVILEMQRVAAIERPGMFPLRKHQNFIESEVKSNGNP